MPSRAIDPTLLIQITSEGMGRGDPELQAKLIRTYLSLLDANEMLPGAISFFTDGVKLAAEGSPVLDVLRSLESKGVHLILCKTCLDHYGLAEKVRVGTIGGMTDILAAQWKAGKVVNI
ncbi:MAG: DsrE family protein [Candidatus Eisenbacteria bacterium]|nr:DsrE family protein [Candidatus Eisenbacteria bacterium]